MSNIYTLRNIITLLAVLIFTACRSTNSGELKTVSSEDKYTAYTQVGEIRDAEGGQRIFVVSKK